MQKKFARLFDPHTNTKPTLSSNFETEKINYKKEK